ncbi:MAG TPA: thioredoxin family protein, partial [Deltaproteobacteria bacterium]|nr:thioredoxin family protein [Deltaproteobacteria bacterium]
MFICNHCPYVKAVEDRILELNREFHPQGIQFVGICANDPSDYPEDSPAKLFQRWKEKNYDFPYLFDESQQTARDYGAVCTPDLYVFDSAQRLFYHGRIDDNW